MNYKSITLFISIILISSCEQYEEFNENPNEPTDVPTSVLMPSAIRQAMNTMTNESFLLGNNIAQLTAKTLRTEVDTYFWNAFPTVWEGLYESLTDINVIEEKSVEAENNLQEGAAVVLKSWVFATLTNAYGDIPYFDAIKGAEDNFTPEYNEQSEIYADILSELERASGLLLSGSGSIDGDIMLNGDPELWLRFANSLRLRLLMLAGNQLPDAGTQFQQIVSSGDIISSNEQNATLTYLGAFPNEFPLIPLKTGDFDAVALSASAFNVMSAYNDPRLSRYARPDNDDYDNPTFSGAENGAGSCDKAGSRLGPQYYDYPEQTTASQLGLEQAEGIAITYAEVEFLLAEAVAKGWITGDIETHYRNGIEASMDYYQVDYATFGYADFNDFYTNSGVDYNVVTDIWEQKWLSLYFTGLQPYFEVRRWYHESGMNFDGIPFLNAACDNLNDDVLPMRFLYPGEEQSLNARNYEAVVEKIGGNTINTSIWLVE